MGGGLTKPPRRGSGDACRNLCSIQRGIRYGRFEGCQIGNTVQASAQRRSPPNIPQSRSIATVCTRIATVSLSNHSTAIHQSRTKYRILRFSSLVAWRENRVHAPYGCADATVKLRQRCGDGKEMDAIGSLGPRHKFPVGSRGAAHHTVFLSIKFVGKASKTLHAAFSALKYPAMSMMRLAFFQERLKYLMSSLIS
jgi:hypothetical protein